MDWIEELRSRLEPVAGTLTLDRAGLWFVLGGALVAIAVPPLWRVLRVAVTLVHELGHALVGMAVGRRFTGFVLRGDMSGHAVTVGKPRGLGQVVSTWAGYPAPAVVGGGMVWLAGRGWSAAFLGSVIVVLLIALVRVRSALTLLVMLVVVLCTGALWWWRDDALQARVLIGAGIVLVVGAWRHLAAVWGTSDRSSDPRALAALTHVPAAVWNLTFVAVCGAASWLVATEVLRMWA